MNINLKTYFKTMFICILIVGILCFASGNLLYGILLIFAAIKFNNAQAFSDQELKRSNTNLLVWAIVCGGATLPFGVAILIFAVMAYRKIDEIEVVEIKPAQTTAQSAQSEQKPAEVVVENVTPVEKTQDEKNYETLESMKRLRDSGVITQEEFDQKRKQLLGE